MQCLKWASKTAKMKGGGITRKTKEHKQTHFLWAGALAGARQEAQFPPGAEPEPRQVTLTRRGPWRAGRSLPSLGDLSHSDVSPELTDIPTLREKPDSGFLHKTFQCVHVSN